MSWDSGGGGNTTQDGRTKAKDVRSSNIMAARAISDAVRTSLGPKGMDKMITTQSGEVIISNDGATILKNIDVQHAAAQMMVDLSASQDIEAGDGTTSVVVIAGCLLKAADNLLRKGVHPRVISDAFQMALKKALATLQSMSMPLDLANREDMLRNATTSLNSKVVSQYSHLLAPIAVDAVLQVIDPATATNVDLRDIKTVKRVGGTIDDTELVEGLVFTQKARKAAGGPSRIVNAKIALIQVRPLRCCRCC